MTEVNRIQAVRGRRAAGSGNPAEPALSKGAELVTIDLFDQLALEGRLFHAQQGDATTQVDFAETAYDEDQPQGALRIPSGTTLVLMGIVITLEDMAGTDTLLALSRTTNDIGNGTSTALAVSNLRPNSGRTSQVQARSLYTANGTAATGLIEIANEVSPYVGEADAGPFVRVEWSKRTLGYRPVLDGPATLQWHIVATGTAPQGFTQIVWAEQDTDDLIFS